MAESSVEGMAWTIPPAPHTPCITFTGFDQLGSIAAAT